MGPFKSSYEHFIIDAKELGYCAVAEQFHTGAVPVKLFVIRM